MIVSLNVTLEEKPSHFQTLLAVPNRHKILLAKLACLYDARIVALSFLFLLFALGVQFFGIADSVQFVTLIKAVAGMPH